MDGGIQIKRKWHERFRKVESELFIPNGTEEFQIPEHKMIIIARVLPSLN
jgi:hypothetical protein